MQKRLSTALMACAVAAAPSIALAAPKAPKPLVAVVDVEAPPTMMGLAAQVTREVLDVAKSEGYPLMRPEDIRGRLGDRDYEELQKCHGNTSCLLLRLGGLRPDRAVVGTLGRDEKSYLVHLWLFDFKRGEVLAEVDRAILIASRRLTRDVTLAVPALLRGEREVRGTLQVTSNASRVAVTVDGEPKGYTPLTLELKPGKHEVHLEKKAYMPVDRLMTVEAKKVTNELVRLILIPGQVPEDEAPPPPLSEVARTAPGEGISLPTGAWVAGGAAIAAGAAGAFFGLSSSNLESKLRTGFDPATNVYQGTRRDALIARQQASLANLCFGVAGVAVATAALMTFLEGTDAKVQVAPAAGPHGAGAFVQGSF